MPTPEYFAKYPPFPDDVPAFELPFISMHKLQAGDAAERNKLFEACTSLGFFRIDLKGSIRGEELLKTAQELFHTSEELHQLDHDELQKYAYKPPHSLFGYKGIGQLKLEDGSPDNVQFYNIGRDDVLGTSAPRTNPPTIEDRRPLFRSFFEQAHAVMELVLARLEECLGLAAGTLASLNPLDQESGTAVRLLRTSPPPTGSPQVGKHALLGHTDLGSLTMLFNAVGGLQILPPQADNVEASWRYVRPEPGCAIINMGDAMVEWTGGVLRSNMHRIAAPPGAQAACVRHSVAYLVRPRSSAPMKRVGDGAVIPKPAEGEEDLDVCAHEWEAMRSTGIIAGKNLARSRGGRPMAASLVN